MTGRALRALRRKYNAQRRKNQRALSRFERQHGWTRGRTTAPFAQWLRYVETAMAFCEIPAPKAAL